MRLAIIGASAVGEATARDLVEHGHDVVIVEQDRQRIDELNDDLDAAFIHGDGSKPRILKEVGVKKTHALLSLSDDDQDNIISSLVGRSLGFKELVTKISDPEFEHICLELGLEHTVSADRITARSIVDTIEGRDEVELSTLLRGDVRFFVLSVTHEEEGRLKDLSLPERTEVLFIYRDDEPRPAHPDLELRKGDDVILLTRTEQLEELQEHWGKADGKPSASS